MAELHYELTDDTIEHEGRRLHRIRATRGTPGVVRRGELGGFIESTHLAGGAPRLAARAWVGQDAKVFDDGRVLGRGFVGQRAQVCGGAVVAGTAQVTGDAVVSEYALVEGGARVFGAADVTGNAFVAGSANIADRARIGQQATVLGATVVRDAAFIGGTARVDGDLTIRDGMWIAGEARIERPEHLLYFGPVGPEQHMATVFRTETGHLVNLDRMLHGTLAGLGAKYTAYLDRSFAMSRDRPAWEAQFEALCAAARRLVAMWREPRRTPPRIGHGMSKHTAGLHYELTDEGIECSCRTVHRMRSAEPGRRLGTGEPTRLMLEAGQ